MWPDRRLLDLFKIDVPIVQAPMAGVMDADLVIAASEGGALGSLPCAMLSVEKAREQVSIIRQRISAPLNMNFFAHTAVDADPAREAVWRKRLTPYFEELGLDPDMPVPAAARAPFDDAMCELVEELKPEVVSFHFGLPDRSLLDRVKATGCVVIGCATLVKEAVWLEQNGADAIIAQRADASPVTVAPTVDLSPDAGGTHAHRQQRAGARRRGGDRARIPDVALVVRRRRVRHAPGAAGGHAHDQGG